MQHVLKISIISSEEGRWRGAIVTNYSSTWSRLGGVSRRGSQVSGEICGQKIGRDDLIPCFQDRPVMVKSIYIYVDIFWAFAIKFEVYSV